MKQLATNLPQKTLSQEQARKNVAKAVAAAQKNLGNPSLSEIDGVTHQKASLQQTGKGNCSGFQN